MVDAWHMHGELGAWHMHGGGATVAAVAVRFLGGGGGGGDGGGGGGAAHHGGARELVGAGVADDPRRGREAHTGAVPRAAVEAGA